MKKFMVFGMVLIAAVIASGESFADVLASDGFDYADGSLVGNGGWANHSGTAGDLQVAGGQVLIQHGIPSEDANLAFSPVAGMVFFGIDFSVSSSGDITGTDHEYFAHFKDDGFNFSARLDVVAATAGGNYSLGIASDESTADTIWGSDLTFGTTYRAVVGFDQAINQAQLWVDATLESDTSILGEDRADPGDTVTQFGLRQSDSDLNELVTVDNLMVGTTFADVATFSAVPEPGSIAFITLGMLGLVARRRRS
ncbi:MAG: hypothetical protein ACI87E_000564 [Mariniblastus sp.]|jgi:hypothetical protein